MRIFDHEIGILHVIAKGARPGLGGRQPLVTPSRNKPFFKLLSADIHSDGQIKEAGKAGPWWRFQKEIVAFDQDNSGIPADVA